MRIRHCISIIVLFLSSLVYAQAPVAAQQLIDTLNQSQTLQAHFKQTVYDEAGMVLQTSEGQFSLQRPGKLRWDVKTPMAQLFVADGKQLWFYDKDLEQITVKPLAQVLQNSPAAWLLKTDSSLTQKYKITVKNLSQQRQQFILKPKQSNASFRQVTLLFKQQRLVSMILADNLQQKTTVQLTRIKQNQPLSERLFRFKPPKNVEVLRES